jgi:hypothetical protein
VIITFLGHRFSHLLKQYADEKQFWFDVSEISENDEVLGAELRLWKRTLANPEFPNDVNEDPASEIIRVAVHQISPGVDDR